MDSGDRNVRVLMHSFQCWLRIIQAAKGGALMGDDTQRIRERAKEQACKLLFGAHWEAIYATPIVELSFESQRDIEHYTDKLLAFALSERDAAIEQCAQIADKLASNVIGIDNPNQRMTIEVTAQKIAAAIRSRVAAQGEKS